VEENMWDKEKFMMVVRKRKIKIDNIEIEIVGK
jgi:hypothetical protein